MAQAPGHTMPWTRETLGVSSSELEGPRRRASAWFDSSLKTIFDDSSDGVLVVNVVGHRVYSNPSLDDLVGADACAPRGTSEPPPYVSADQRPKYARLLGGMATLLSVEGSGTVSTSIDLVTRRSGRVRSRLRISAFTSVDRERFAVCLFAPEFNSAIFDDPFAGASSGASSGSSGRSQMRSDPTPGFDLTSDVETLTRREREVLALLLDGRRVASISRTLYLSEHTVRNHLKAIFRKLDTHSQTELLDRFRPPA
ncbi:MAG: helix-turn-helix transcriptional regulator [Acidimicrobiales bacterium]